jgi:hypothetical protein
LRLVDLYFWCSAPPSVIPGYGFGIGATAPQEAAHGHRAMVFMF